MAGGDGRMAGGGPRAEGGQGLQVGRTVEEAEVGVAVQLGVGKGGAAGPELGRWPVGLAVVRPGRAVTPVTIGGKRAGPARQTRLELRPGNRWVSPPHGPSV